jgi:nitroreductase
MDLHEAIEQRWSVRQFEPRPVEEEKLLRVLEAGRLSPSAKNRQERKVVVVREEARRRALAEAAEQPWLAAAPVILAMVGTTPESVMHCGVPTDPVDCAIALDHMSLAAVAEGLGTCWIGHFDQDACRRILGVPAAAKIVELMPLGYPSGRRKSRARKELQEVVCHEQYR